MEQTKLCTDCNTNKPISQFYKSNTHSQGVMYYCSNCFNKRCIARWIQRKLKAIEYKGNKCMRCNLDIKDSHYSVFDFHHTHDKDYDWSKLRLQSWIKITQELDKCKLLCSNCHRIVHSLDFPDQSKSH